MDEFVDLLSSALTLPYARNMLQCGVLLCVAVRYIAVSR